MVKHGEFQPKQIFGLRDRGSRSLPLRHDIKWEYPPTILEVFLDIAPIKLEETENFTLPKAVLKEARSKLKKAKEERIQQKSDLAALELAAARTPAEIFDDDNSQTKNTRTWADLSAEERAPFEERSIVEDLRMEFKSSIRLIENAVRDTQQNDGEEEEEEGEE